VGLINLGCPKNQIDSEWMLGRLKEQGHRFVKPHNADVLIINTCAFIKPAIDESFELIEEALAFKDKNGPKIIIAGCLVERYGSELLQKFDGLNGIIGVDRIMDIGDVVDKVCKGENADFSARPDRLSFPEVERSLLSPRHYAYLKIADGCSNRCSYCKIPSLRGEYRSREFSSIIKEASHLVLQGVKEIVLVAQDTTLYGIDLYSKTRLPELLKELSKIKGIRWLRLLYAHPAHFTPELIELISENEKVCKYVDLPIQHISNRILSNMNRKISEKQIRNLIEKLKNTIPDLALRTELMVGFPKEREEDFEKLVEFIEEVKFDWIGIFKYYSEDGTKSSLLSDQIPEEMKEERYNILFESQRETSFEKNNSFIGRDLVCIVDKKVKGKFECRGERDAPEIDGLIYTSGDAKVGEFINVTIEKADDYDLYGNQT